MEFDKAEEVFDGGFVETEGFKVKFGFFGGDFLGVIDDVHDVGGFII